MSSIFFKLFKFYIYIQLNITKLLIKEQITLNAKLNQETCN